MLPQVASRRVAALRRQRGEHDAHEASAFGLGHRRVALHARALRSDGTIVEGLYASGNTTASVMGRTYPGPGSTLGPSITFAWRGANHALDALGQSSLRETA